MLVTIEITKDLMKKIKNRELWICPDCGRVLPWDYDYCDCGFEWEYQYYKDQWWKDFLNEFGLLEDF